MSEVRFSLFDLSGVPEAAARTVESFRRLLEPYVQAHAAAKSIEWQAVARARAGAIDRALGRVVAQEERRQKNIDEIVKGAIPFLTPRSSNVEPDEDWIAHFFTSCQDVGNVEMRSVWSKLLAGEFSRCRSFSPRAIDCVRLLTEIDAKAFTSVASLTWADGDVRYLPAGSGALLVVRNHGVGWNVLSQLQSIGLLEPNECSLRGEWNRAIGLEYFGERVAFRSASTEANSFYSLSSVGCELFSISGAEPLRAYSSDVQRYWRSQHALEAGRATDDPAAPSAAPASPS